MRLTPLARRLGSAALVLTIGVGVSACSDDSSAESASDSSSDSTSDSISDSSADSGSSSDESGGEAEADAPAELSAEDFYPEVMAAMQDAETFNFTTVSSSAGQSQTMTGQARFSDDGIEMKASSEGPQAMELVLLGQAMYMKSPELGTGDKWLKIDLSDPDSLFGMIGKATDPEVMFKALEAPKKLELVGAEDVDGVATNHYRITVDPTKYVEAMEFPAAMADMLPKELVTEMWVDADNLPRKFAQTMEVPAVGGGKPTTSTTEGTYSDFGTDVEIEAPPSSQVTQQPGM
ncbi:hypothetical protein ASG76_08705 [Nocardioides sp. Soil774]|uniref:hypothetical protein n=1 Tax=Nocardioides sp. Soil774 TaxID=1736408 RepID=UPI0006F5F4BA|nr:hypothetical protein [Nocardioides sp. Soil774]KRE95684.1 hypothetical protein ASG76_08705 [Nocardioides sp. Soil774]